MPETRPHAELLFDPAPGSWPGLVRVPPSDETTRRTREMLGLALDRPVIMAGHQPGFWHPGILAKWVATHALAERVGGVGAWVVVDQSPGAGARIAYPAIDREWMVRLAEEWRQEPDAPRSYTRPPEPLLRRVIVLGELDSPPAAQPPARIEKTFDSATAHVSSGRDRIQWCMEDASGEPNLARQLHMAASPPLNKRFPVVSNFATDLHATAAFAELVGAMRSDPKACARLYNQAASQRPDAGVRELAIAAAAVELPLWERADTPGPWRTVTSDRLPDLPDHRLVLRGLPMTGLLRWRACDLFIHGTGGGASHAEEGYDRVTEQWLAGWLGATDLAPAVVASATLRLDFGDLAREIPTPERIARARELAHRAAHDPALLGDASLGERKRALAAQIAALPRGSDQRAGLFARMQALREEGTRSNPDRLADLHRQAEALAARAEEADIVADRTWPWVFFPRQAIEELCDQITAAVGSGDAPQPR